MTTVAYPGPFQNKFAPDDPRLGRKLRTDTGVWPEGTPPEALPKYRSLLEECLAKPMLPSLAYFYRHGCSLKWKRDPQHRYVKRYFPAAQAAWDSGQKCVKVIGYDAGPADARRANITDDEQYTYWHPLRDWGWDRDQCKAEIEAEGLPVPLKSACFFCPSAKTHEITWLVRNHPVLADLIITMERRAAPTLTEIEGLWSVAFANQERPTSTMTEWIERVRAADAAGKGRSLPSYSEEGCDGCEAGGGCVAQ